MEQLLTKPLVDCKTVDYNALEMFPHIFYTQPMDSAVRAIHFWEQVCGVSEPIQRIKILVAIHNRNFSEQLYDTRIIHFIKVYQYISDFKNDSSQLRRSFYYEYYSRMKAFNEFTSKLAEKLISVADTNSLEYFFCKLYSGRDDLPQVYSDPKFSNTLLVKSVEKEKRQFKRTGVGHISIVGGVWIPSGNLHLLGAHPYAGFQIGIKRLVDRIDFEMGFRFVSAANTYQIKRNNSLINSDHYFGGYFGIEYGREIITGKKQFVEIIAGIGGEGFDVLNSEKLEDPDRFKPLSIFSFNVNSGLQYNFILNQRRTLGVQGKYHFIKYNNKGGTDLRGNAFSAGLVVGFYRPELFRRDYRPF